MCPAVLFLCSSEIFEDEVSSLACVDPGGLFPKAFITPTSAGDVDAGFGLTAAHFCSDNHYHAALLNHSTSLYLKKRDKMGAQLGLTTALGPGCRWTAP